MREPEMESRRVTADVPGYPRHSVAFGGKESFFEEQCLLDTEAMINLKAEGIRIVRSPG